MFKILVGERHEFALLVFVAFDDFLPRHFLAGRFVDPPIADRRKIAAVEQVERERVVLGSREQVHGNVHQTE